MPIGSAVAVSHIARHILLHRPKRVLDLGIGTGFYGAVVRQWADEGVQPWQTWLEGVEVWAEYRNPLWDLYNLVRVEPIERFLDRPHDPFDSILLCDVLEHFDSEAGGPLIDSVRQLLTPGGTLIVNTPGAFNPQGAVHGNEYERHRSLWRSSELEELGFSIQIRESDDAMGMYPTILASWTRLE